MKLKMPPKPKISRRAITALIFVPTAAVALTFLIISVFLIQSVNGFRIVGDTVYEDEYLIENCGVELGEKLFFKNRAEAEKKLLEAAPRLKNVKLRPALFSTLVIEVEEEKAAYYSEINGEYYLLSSDLRVLEMSKSSDAYAEEATRFELYSNDIQSAIEGEHIKFKDERILNEVLSFAEDIAEIPLGDYAVTSFGYQDGVSRDAYAVIDGRLKIIFEDTDTAVEKIGFALTFINESGIKYEYSQIRITEGKNGYEASYSEVKNVE